jgi:hypothetical protein
MYKVMPKSNFTSDSIDFKAFKNYFVFEVTDSYYKLFDENGLIGLAAKDMFNIVNNLF